VLRRRGDRPLRLLQLREDARGRAGGSEVHAEPRRGWGRGEEGGDLQRLPGAGAPGEGVGRRR
jgi:hypothetical protein